MKNIWSHPVTLKQELAQKILSSNISSTFRFGGLSHGIDLKKPTLLIVTVTYKRTKRLSLLRRLTSIIHQHQTNNKIRCEGSVKEQQDCRQFVWILCEDGSAIDTQLADLLNCSKIPHVYFAYGPTNRFGNSQRNAILEYIVNLTHIFNFTSSVRAVDDDSYQLPDAFDLAYNVKKVALIPVVGLGPEGIEYAVPDHNSMAKEMRAGWMSRKFPVDYNGLAWSTNIFGQMWQRGQRLFWPYTGRGGETEFLELFLKELKEIHVPCNKCKTVFYNKPLQDTDVLFTCPLVNHNTLETTE